LSLTEIASGVLEENKEIKSQMEKQKSKISQYDLITTSQYDNQLDHNNLISEINKQEDNLRVLKASKVELEGRKTLLENQIDESERLKVILEKNLDQTKLNLKNLQRDIDNIRNDEKITNLKNQIDAQKKID